MNRAGTEADEELDGDFKTCVFQKLVAARRPEDLLLEYGNVLGIFVSCERIQRVKEEDERWKRGLAWFAKVKQEGGGKWLLEEWYPEYFDEFGGILLDGAILNVFSPAYRSFMPDTCA